MTGRVTSLDAAEDASQAVVGTSMGTIWYGQATCLLVSTHLHYSAALICHHPGVKLQYPQQCPLTNFVLSTTQDIEAASMRAWSQCVGPGCGE